jgi:hypothetical protein
LVGSSGVVWCAKADYIDVQEGSPWEIGTFFGWKSALCKASCHHDEYLLTKNVLKLG